MATAKKSRVRSRVSVSVSPCIRYYAVVIVANGKPRSVTQRHLSIWEAEAYCRSYNTTWEASEQKAVIVPHDALAAATGISREVLEGGHNDE